MVDGEGYSEELEQTLPCDQCDKPTIFPSLRSLKAHMKKAGNHQPECKQCKVNFKNYHNFGAHIRLYHIRKDENLEIPCDLCGKCYRNIHLLNNHCNIVHKVEDNLICNLCENLKLISQ